MGFFDDVSSAVNRGTAAAQRTGQTVKIRAQLSDLLRRRQQLAAQLGASLYDQTKTDPVFRAGREQLYDDITSLDVQRADLQARIEALESQAQSSDESTRLYTCPKCGSRVSEIDTFCSGCGARVADIIASEKVARATAQAVVNGGMTCPKCGNAVAAGDSFCMNCGANLQETENPQNASAPVVETVEKTDPSNGIE